MAIETIPFDAVEHPDTSEAQAAFLDEAFREGDPAGIAQALGIIARARGMTSVAKDAGVTREALYKALSSEGDPRLSTLLGVTSALGFRIGVEASPSAATGTPA